MGVFRIEYYKLPNVFYLMEKHVKNDLDFDLETQNIVNRIQCLE